LRENGRNLKQVINDEPQDFKDVEGTDSTDLLNYYGGRNHPV